jgi:hypothetical protein
MPMLKKLLDRSLEVAVSSSISGKAFDSPSRKRSSYPYNFLFLLKIGCLATYISIDGHLEAFEKHPFLLYFFVPVERDLHRVPTGSNFNPPPNFGGLILKIPNVFLW